MTEMHEVENEAGLQALLQSPERVSALRLTGEDISTEIIEQLLASPLWPTLEALDLTWSHLTPAAIERLCAAPATQLKSLNLSANIVEAPQLSALAGAPWFADLETLELSEMELDDDGIEALAQGMVKLRRLDLLANDIGARGVRALAQTRLPEHLVELDLFANLLNAQAAQALAEVTWPSLKALQISGNELGDSGVHTLMTSQAFPRLEALRASSNGTTSAGICRSLKACTLTSLKALGLAKSDIDDEAAGALASCHVLDGLEQLDISRNRELGGQGLQRLAQA